MEQLVRVRRTFDDGTALVSLEKSCFGDCHKCTACERNVDASFRAKNPIGAKPGELVRMGKRQITWWPYLLPPLLFFGAYTLGKIAACLGFCLGLILTGVFERKIVAYQITGYPTWGTGTEGKLDLD